MDKTKQTTKILYDKSTGAFYCEKCRFIFDYNFGFSKCPHCRRDVVKSEKRW